jgi:hypothetical protein
MKVLHISFPQWRLPAFLKKVKIFAAFPDKTAKKTDPEEPYNSYTNLLYTKKGE